tara:strand:+ start:14423 stop:14548 length:126 start_codon:yes stop_codon:yes gene_type:complete
MLKVMGRAIGLSPLSLTVLATACNKELCAVQGFVYYRLFNI